MLPGSCCPVTGAAPHSEPPHRNRPRGLSASSRMTGSGSRLLPGRPLLSLGLLQLLLGGSMVALSFGALSLSNSPPIRNSCPFWAGSSVSSPPCAVVDGCSPSVMHAPVRGCSHLCGLMLVKIYSEGGGTLHYIIISHFKAEMTTDKRATT